MQIKTIFPALAVYFLAFAPLWAQQVESVRFDEHGKPIIVKEDGRMETLGGQPVEDRRLAVLRVEIEPLPGNTPVTYEDLRRIADRQAQLARIASEIAEQRANEARQQRMQLSEAYEQAKRSNTDPETLRRMEQRLQAAQEMENSTATEAERAKQEAKRAKLMTEEGKYVEEYKRQQEAKRRQVQQYEQVDLRAAGAYGSLVHDDGHLPFGHSPEVLQAQAQDCQIAYEGLNDKQLFERALAREVLFTHTDDRMRPFLDGKEYLTCRAGLQQTGGYRYLVMEFTFALANAREAYGFIERGSYLMITTLGNQYVKLFCRTMDNGEYDTQTEMLTYRVHYDLDQSQLNLLKREEIDKVIMGWSSGHEEYEVFNPGFFVRQVRCLER